MKLLDRILAAWKRLQTEDDRSAPHVVSREDHSSLVDIVRVLHEIEDEDKQRRSKPADKHD
jgi:hypothetical protein